MIFNFYLQPIMVDVDLKIKKEKGVNEEQPMEVDDDILAEEVRYN